MTSDQTATDPLALPDAVSDVEAGKASLDQHGMVIHRNLLSAVETKALYDRVIEQAELEREQGVATLSPTGSASDMQFAPAGAAMAPFQAVTFLPNKGDVFRKIMCHPAIKAYGTHLFRSVPFYLVSQSATIVRNGAQGQVIHTDQQAWPFVTPVPIMFTVAICLTDFEPDMGSTRLAIGTNTGDAPAIALDKKTGLAANPAPIETRSISAPAGSIAMWEGRLWHGQGSSTSDIDRVSVIQSYSMHMVRPQDNYASCIQDDVLAKLTDEQRAMLGFEVHFDYAGRVMPRSADDARTNSNYRFPYVPELNKDSPARAVPLDNMNIGHTSELAQLVK